MWQLALFSILLVKLTMRFTSGIRKASVQDNTTYLTNGGNALQDMSVWGVLTGYHEHPGLWWPGSTCQPANCPSPSLKRSQKKSLNRRQKKSQVRRKDKDRNQIQNFQNWFLAVTTFRTGKQPEDKSELLIPYCVAQRHVYNDKVIM